MQKEPVAWQPQHQQESLLRRGWRAGQVQASAVEAGRLNSRRLQVCQLLELGWLLLLLLLPLPWWWGWLREEGGTGDEEEGDEEGDEFAQGMGFGDGGGGEGGGGFLSLSMLIKCCSIWPVVGDSRKAEEE